MGLFSALVKIGVDVVRLPVAVTMDAITLCGIVTEQHKPYTAKILDQIKKDSEEAND